MVQRYAMIGWGAIGLMLSAVEGKDCYSNTTELMQAVEEANISEVTQYTLCPDTVFSIGDTDSYKNGTTVVSGGMAPLLVRTNITYTCGSFGRSESNCVMEGGNVQVLSFPHLFQEAVENCFFEGITFRNASQSGVLLANEGSVMFDDCVFEVRLLLFLPGKAMMRVKFLQVRCSIISFFNVGP